MRAATVLAVIAACVLLAAASVEAQPKPARALVRPAKAATAVKPTAKAGQPQAKAQTQVSPASGSKSGAIAAQCNRQALLLVRNDMVQVLTASCVKRRKQSRAYCGSLAERKIAALRKAVVQKCEAKHPKAKAFIELQRKHKAAAAKGDEDPRLHPTGFIGKIADYLVQKASGTTSAEVASGCDFQRKMNCRAWITDCADSCMGESMGTCQGCMGAHFGDCCQCDIVRQFGVQSCSY